MDFFRERNVDAVFADPGGGVNASQSIDKGERFMAITRRERITQRKRIRRPVPLVRLENRCAIAPIVDIPRRRCRLGRDF